MTAHLLKNNDREYKCVTCGSDNVSVIREDKEDPRLKCNSCNFLFNASHATAASKAGAIPESSPESLAGAQEPETIRHDPNSFSSDLAPLEWGASGDDSRRSFQFGGNAKTVPKTPAYVFISKDRLLTEFSSRKDVKSAALKWAQNGPFDAFELVPKKFEVNLDIS